MSSQSGFSKIAVVVFLLLGFAVLYPTYKILPFYFYFYDLKNQMHAQIRAAEFKKDEEIKSSLAEKIKYAQIPADLEKLTIQHEGKNMRIALGYDEIFYVTWKGKDYDIIYFHFLSDISDNVVGASQMKDNSKMWYEFAKKK